MKRKAFTFYESYYQVIRELDDDKDKLDFVLALLQKQFEGIEPTNLTKMSSFAYKSQQHSINKQVDGYETKTGHILTPYQDPTEGSNEGSREGSYEPPLEGCRSETPMTTEGSREGSREQEQGKGKGKEQAQYKEQEHLKNHIMDELLEQQHLLNEFIK